MSNQIRRFERGSNVLEWIGILIMAASLIVVIAGPTTNLGPRLSAAVCEAVNRVLDTEGACGSEESEGPGEQPQPSDQAKDYHPEKCELLTTKETYSGKNRVGVKDIAYFEMGEGGGFIRTVYSDGTVKLTVSSNSSYGVKLKSASEIDKYLKQTVDFGAGVTFKNGESWTLESEAEADAYYEDLKTYIAFKMTQQSGYETNGINATTIWSMGETVTGEKFTQPPTPPTERVTSVSPAFKLGRKEKSSTLGRERIVSIGGKGVWVKKFNSATQETSKSIELEAVTERGQYNPGISTSTGTKSSGSMKVTRNKDGKLVGLTIETAWGVTAEGGIAGKTNRGEKSGNSGGLGVETTESTGKSRVIRTHLELDPNDPDYEEKARIVEDWLGGESELSSAMNIRLDHLMPTSATPGDEFQNLLFNDAQVSSIDYSIVGDQWDFGYNIGLRGVGFEFDGQLGDTESTADSAEYLEAPEGGIRAWEDFTNCIP